MHEHARQEETQAEPPASAPAALVAPTVADMLGLQRSAGNRAATQLVLGRQQATRQILAREKPAEVELAEELAPKLDSDTTAPDAIAKLDGGWIQYIVFIVKLLVERFGKKDQLVKHAKLRPRVQAALDTVLNPDAAKTGTGLTGLPTDQQAQLRGFARRREWPTAIPKKGASRPAELDDPLSELNGIIAAVWHERRAVEDNMSGDWKPPTWSKAASVAQADRGKKSTLSADDVEAMPLSEQNTKFKDNLRGGYMKSAAGDTLDPTSYAPVGAVAPADRARIEAINRLVWAELGHEGDVGSINTYDNAVLTWGKGWAASGRLPKLMEHLPQTFKDRLLDLGFAYQGGTWLALGVGDKCVFEGPDALQYVRFNTAILSEMYAMGQGTNAQKLADAQADVMFTEFDRMPAAIRGLDDRLIQVIVHCCWWGNMTMTKAVALTGAVTGTTEQLRAVVRWQADHGSIRSGTSHGAVIVTGWQANLFQKMGGGVIASTFTERADAPADTHSGKTLIKPDNMSKYIVV